VAQQPQGEERSLNLRQALLLLLFLGLVALAIVIIEALPAPAPRGGPVGAETLAAGEGGDLLVLRFGLTPDPSRTPGAAQATPPRPPAGSPTEAQTTPAAKVPAVVDDPDDYHVVARGETLSGIARDRLGSARLAGELARLNGLQDADSLREGQVLRLR